MCGAKLSHDDAKEHTYQTGHNSWIPVKEVIVNLGFWESAIGHGRILQWIVCGGGMAVALVGGTQGWLTADNIIQIILAEIAAAFGLEAVNNKGGKNE